jgi:hypothetical protein
MNPSSPHENLMFDIGMLFSLLATGVHLGVIIVGGRATSLCFRIAATPKPETDPEVADFREGLRHVDFARYIAYCERLQLAGTMFLLLSILFIAFFLFTHIVFPLILVGTSVLGGMSVYRTGFWSVSVVRENIMRLVRPANESNRKPCKSAGGSIHSASRPTSGGSTLAGAGI